MKMRCEWTHFHTGSWWTFVSARAAGFGLTCAPLVVRQCKTCGLGKPQTYRSDSQAQPDGPGQAALLSVNPTAN